VGVVSFLLVQALFRVDDLLSSGSVEGGSPRGARTTSSDEVVFRGSDGGVEWSCPSSKGELARATATGGDTSDTRSSGVASKEFGFVFSSSTSMDVARSSKIVIKEGLCLKMVLVEG
jgi:hypothetical protein